MSGGLTGAAALAALNYLTGRSLDLGTSPQTLSLALLTASPPPDPGIGDLSEVAAVGYARQAVSWSPAVTPSAGQPSSVSNAANVLFGPFTSVGGLGFPTTHCALLGTGVAANTSNLLTANQSGIETDASGWVGLLNASVSQSTAQAQSGTHSLAVTSTPAAGDSQVCLAARVAVSPYTVYAGTGWAFSAVTGTMASLELAFYDSSGTLIQRSGSVSSALPASAWTQYSYSVVAPANAVTASPILHSAPTASGTVTFWDGMSFAATTVQRVLMTWEFDAPGSAAQNESLQISAAALDMTLG